MKEKVRPERLLAAILSFSDEALLTFALAARKNHTVTRPRK
jgi:hypothetical protein